MKLKILAVVLVALIAASGLGYGLLRYLKQPQVHAGTSVTQPAETVVVTPPAPVSPVASEPSEPVVPPAPVSEMSPTVPVDAAQAYVPPVVPGGESAPAKPPQIGKNDKLTPQPVQTLSPEPIIPGQGMEIIHALSTNPEALRTLSAGQRIAYLKQILELDAKQVMLLNDYYGGLIQYNGSAYAQGQKFAQPLFNMVDSSNMGSMPPPLETMQPGMERQSGQAAIDARIAEIGKLAEDLKAASGLREGFIKSLTDVQRSKLEAYIKAGVF